MGIWDWGSWQSTLCLSKNAPLKGRRAIENIIICDLHFLDCWLVNGSGQLQRKKRKKKKKLQWGLVPMVFFSVSLFGSAYSYLFIDLVCPLTFEGWRIDRGSHCSWCMWKEAKKNTKHKAKQLRKIWIHWSWLMSVWVMAFLSFIFHFAFLNWFFRWRLVMQMVICCLCMSA